MFASIVFVLSTTVLITANDAAKILAYFPVPSISHQVVFRPLTQELARRGHVVTVITTDPAFPTGEAPPNLTEIDIHDVSYKKWRSLYEVTSTGDSDLISQIRQGFYMFIELVEMQLEEDKIQKILKEEKFDLLFLEACVRPALLLSHVVKAPVIHVSSLGPMNYNVETMGSSWHPLLYPDILSKRLYNLTKSEKIVELWNYYRLENLMQELEDAENVMTKRIFGPNVPTISELKNNVEMLFLNSHPIWEGNRPVPPSVIYMGGLLQKPVNELPAVSYFL